ncbi:hypothetical protein [Paenibacillus sp. J2TS4]|uniref:hypothetical protein n=1 Tax=Paenibacillus sp. J2TS4 TaxID=2807194 RepID=UPI001B16917A|nr:hypothetical protein [Paenibacillus sp. J2TS4]GIP33538.1 hypothetical protein J2TS4_27480 [Paenibacillus sp. J2TS4]
MIKQTEKFYSNRVLTAFLSVLMFAAAYIIYTKLLAETDYITEVAYFVFYGVLIVAVVVGLACAILTFDPRPIIQISPDGIGIRSFIFIAEFVPWNEVVGTRNEVYKNRVGAGVRITVSANLFRIYRPNKRSLAINLTLLNKRGDGFNKAFSKYMEV